MTLKIMTYNILDGGVGREQFILEVLQAVQPDIAILQEVYETSFLQDLGTALNMEPFLASGNKRRRVAFLSRLPIRSAKSHHPLLPIWCNVVQAEIEYDFNKTLYIFGIHPKSDLAIVWEWWRWWEAKRILKYAAVYSNKPCLIAGDFNAIAPDDAILIKTMPKWLKLRLWSQGNRAYHFSIQEYLAAGFTDSFRYLNKDNNGFTLPPPYPNARLDYIFVNSILKDHLRSCWVVDASSAVEKASDHYPVVAEFEL